MDSDELIDGSHPDYLREKIATLERQLSDLREKLDWSLISPDNLPRVGDEVWRDLGEDQGGVVVEDVDADMQATWTIEDYKLEYWSHRRPINAPERDKEQGK